MEKSQTNGKEVVAAESKRGFLDHTGIYLFDFVVALICFGIVASLLSFVLYLLFNQLTSSTSYYTISTTAAWGVASLVVWIPLAVIFYSRSRGEELAHPELRDDLARRVLIIIFRVIILLATIGFVFAAVYSAVNLAISPELSVQNTLLGMTVPSLLSAVAFGGLWFAYTRTAKPSRRLFIGVVLASAIVAVVVLLTLSIVNVRTKPAHHYNPVKSYDYDDTYYNAY